MTDTQKLIDEIEAMEPPFDDSYIAKSDVLAVIRKHATAAPADVRERVAAAIVDKVIIVCEFPATGSGAFRLEIKNPDEVADAAIAALQTASTGEVEG